METTRVTDYLSRDPLRHIVPLKVLSAHPRDVRAQYFSNTASGAGVMLLLPRAASAFDSVHYPETQFAVIISSDAPALTEEMLDAIPAGCGLIFKLTSSGDRAVIAKRFPLEHITSFLSYTSAPGAGFPASTQVSISTKLDHRLALLFNQNGHGQEELERCFSSEGALSLALYQNGEPLSACFVHPNYENVWEISAVNTAEAARRKGYARQVVETALNTLIANGYTPRYQMHENNLASKNLAESLGLEWFLTTEHLLSLPSI